jgi:hypothetical protein
VDGTHHARSNFLLSVRYRFGSATVPSGLVFSSSIRPPRSVWLFQAAAGGLAAACGLPCAFLRAARKPTTPTRTSSPPDRRDAPGPAREQGCVPAVQWRPGGKGAGARVERTHSELAIVSARRARTAASRRGTGVQPVQLVYMVDWIGRNPCSILLLIFCVIDY